MSLKKKKIPVNDGSEDDKSGTCRDEGKYGLSATDGVDNDLDTRNALTSIVDVVDDPLQTLRCVK